MGIKKDRTCGDFEDRLRQILGSYNKSKLDFSLYQPHIENAIERARNLDTNSIEYWPSKLGSHVYKLVEILLKTLND